MYGTAGTVGLIVPSNNTVIEREFNRLLPEMYGVVATRVWNTETTEEDLQTMPERAVRCAKELATAEVDVVAFGCTSGSFLRGPLWEADLRRRLADAAQVPVVTTSSAFISALTALGARTAVLATPYPDDINAKERSYMEANDIDVVNSAGMGIRRSVDIGKLAPEDVYKFVRVLDVAEADAVFVSCTNLRTVDVIERLERDLGKPVVSSNQATLWHSLVTMGHTKRIQGVGTLLRRYMRPAMQPGRSVNRCWG